MSTERPTLVQQRLTINRDPVGAIWMIVFAVLIAATGVARIVVGGSPPLGDCATSISRVR